MIRDVSFGERMEEQFHEDIRYATAIDPEAFRGRPWSDYVIEWPLI